MMNFKQLEAFRAVMLLGSTKAASERLIMSQSAISRLISQLERELGIELFQRSKGRLISKPEADDLLRNVSDIVERVQGVARQAEELRHKRFRRQLLKVAVPVTLTLELMPRLINEFLNQHPRIVVEILSGSYATIDRMIETREADIGFRRLSVECPFTSIEHLADTPGVCIMPKKHPLTRLDVIRGGDLKEMPMVLLGRRSSSRGDIDRFFQEAGFQPRVNVEVHSVGVACHFVSKGLGVSIVNELMARQFQDRLIDIRPIKPAPQYSYGLIYRPNAPRSKLTQEFAKFMRAYLGSTSVD